MKTFMAVYTAHASDAERAAARADTQKMKAFMEAWTGWLHTNQASIVDTGAPLGKTKRVDIKGVADASNNMAAFTIVQADSYDAAAALFARHPHISLFSGNAVEIMECLPIPKMPK